MPRVQSIWTAKRLKSCRQTKEGRYLSKQPNNLLSARVRKAAAAVMQKNGRITYPELFIEMGILSEKNLLDWRKGRVPFLERVIVCNLTKLARIMTAVRRLAQE